MFRERNKPKYGKREFAFSGLLYCAYDNCAVTAKLKKNRYTYYHCTGYRGKCDLPYFREEELGERLAATLRNIHIPDDVLLQLEKSLLTDKGHAEAIREEQGKTIAEQIDRIASPARSGVPGQAGRQNHRRVLESQISRMDQRRTASVVRLEEHPGTET